MKSKKVKEIFGNSITSEITFAIKFIEIAEQEIIEKAIDAHRKQCNALNEFDICVRVGFASSICDITCEYMEDFINHLNNK